MSFDDGTFESFIEFNQCLAIVETIFDVKLNNKCICMGETDETDEYRELARFSSKNESFIDTATVNIMTVVTR
jgi:hypothetical protein